MSQLLLTHHEEVVIYIILTCETWFGLWFLCLVDDNK